MINDFLLITCLDYSLYFWVMGFLEHADYLVFGRMSLNVHGFAYSYCSSDMVFECVTKRNGFLLNV